MDPVDVIYLMSLKCDLRVCRIVDPNMTVRTGMELKYLCPETAE